MAAKAAGSKWVNAEDSARESSAFTTLPDDMTEIDVENASQLLNHFQNHARDSRQEAINDFQNRFVRLRDEYLERKVSAAEAARNYAIGFNIFRLLGVAHDEQRTHSALLADLLSPNGSHGQQHLFLRHFLAYCHKKFNKAEFEVVDIETTEWEVHTEYHTPLGRLDILLQNPELGLQYVIENKIHAAEHNNQLRRYALWQKDQGEKFQKQALIYLTLSGHEPSSYQGMLYPLSYKRDVVTWLEGTIDEVAASRMQEIIHQYLDLIHYLTRGIP